MTTPNGTPNESSFDPAKLERVEELLQQLKSEAREAETANDLYMLSVYNDLLHVASPIVVKAHARIEREARAASNKAERILRKQEREARVARNAAKQPASS